MTPLIGSFFCPVAFGKFYVGTFRLDDGATLTQAFRRSNGRSTEKFLEQRSEGKDWLTPHAAVCESLCLTGKVPHEYIS